MAYTHVVQRELPVTGGVLKSGTRLDASAFVNLQALVSLGYLRPLTAQEAQEPQDSQRPAKGATPTAQSGKA